MNEDQPGDADLVAEVPSYSELAETHIRATAGHHDDPDLIRSACADAEVQASEEDVARLLAALQQALHTLGYHDDDGLVPAKEELAAELRDAWGDLGSEHQLLDACGAIGGWL